MKESAQEQLVAARRNQILDAAAKVFATKGFHPTTIRDIAREAGIADGTIYNYFENKPALLLGVFDRMTEIARQDAAISLSAPVDLRDFVRAYIHQPLMALKTDNFELFRVIISEIMVNAELRQSYYSTILEPGMRLAEGVFQRWVEQHIIKAVDVRLLMRMISSIMLGLILENIMGDPVLQTQWDDLPDFVTDILLDGIRNNTP